jgi:hypothetical protein
VIRVLRSTSLRLALSYGALFIAFSALLVGLLWWRTADVLDREINAVIVSDTRAIGDRLHDFGLAGALQTINQRVSQTADEHAIYLLADPTYARVGGNLTAWPPEAGETPGWYQIELVHDGKRHATRGLHVILPAGFHLLVGRDVQDRLAIRDAIVTGLIWASVAAIVLAAIGGLLVRRTVLHRVEQINRTAGAIVRGDLSRRVPTRESADEFDRLAQTINRMLQQIQLLVEGVRNSSNSIAHELRTPLAEVRARLEDVLRTRPPAESVIREVQAAVAEIDHVIGVFGALLRLAEIDSGARLSGFRAVDLAEVVSEVAELYGPVAEERSIELSLDAPAGLVVNGDPYLLAQAVGNLLDNAIKYAPAETPISIQVQRRQGDRIAIAVADRGPGIAEAEKPHVAERFFRGRASGTTSGVGLGLSLVTAVARLHGGSLALIDHEPGLIAELTLPAPIGVAVAGD